ncbi:MAG: hypothetical protein FJ130_01885 [Deltaproteobacteria bacterium]|nr:hypothetical protein [Deltaproteobacteria bacterium]
MITGSGFQERKLGTLPYFMCFVLLAELVQKAEAKRIDLTPIAKHLSLIKAKMQVWVFRGSIFGIYLILLPEFGGKGER